MDVFLLTSEPYDFSQSHLVAFRGTAASPTDSHYIYTTQLTTLLWWSQFYKTAAESFKYILALI